MKDDKEVKEFQQYLIAEANSQNKDPESYIKELGEDGIKEAYQRFQEYKKNEAQKYKKKEAQKAEHGAKLNYFKKLKNICEEDEELVYYKRGGSVDCGCVKKAQTGTTVPKKKQTPIEKFKRSKAEQDRINKLSEEDYFRGYADHDVNNKVQNNKTSKTRTKAEQDRINKLSEQDYYRGYGDHNVRKHCGGTKMKLAKKGDKVCPKCGKVHSAGMGCAVAKFKMHRQGGSLNGVPFIREALLRME